MSEYDFEIICKPSYSLLKFKLNNQEIMTETGSMVYMDPKISIETSAKGGVLGVLKRAVVGESVFMNKLKGNGVLALAPACSGDIAHHELNGTLYASSGAYLASSPHLSIDTKFGGTKTFFGGQGLFLMKIEGKGDVFLSAYGALEEIELNNESIIVDNGHLVAFTSGLEYSLGKLGGLKSALLGGEGLVYTFKGTGKVYIQTRNIQSFVGFISPYLPKTSQ
ncbi:protein of unknown function DUF124 [Methanococcus vannielii SB]|jgi:uncharacterized protein (TIGR00266 family)|uniref:TIGR00266 family protein n=1 Tax=Methanococcus vannielii (strain ATCC 35089 / DSM 1224 / JCM 13029 / OCM 148 / SB) TaxID=406327 RepID=A6USB8_METVS|nr:TIGR00266 family protein [Methanococcus vannielii]ABR55390.1 protein of unknown function DUF124 [Methanococcus vannielii SB]